MEYPKHSIYIAYLKCMLLGNGDRFGDRIEYGVSVDESKQSEKGEYGAGEMACLEGDK